MDLGYYRQRESPAPRKLFPLLFQTGRPPIGPATAGSAVVDDAIGEYAQVSTHIARKFARRSYGSPGVATGPAGRLIPAAWVRAGLAWQRLALTAHDRGLAVAPLTAVVENPRTRQAAGTLVPAGQAVLMLFRLGRSPGPLPPTARRDPTWRRPP